MKRAALSVVRRVASLRLTVAMFIALAVVVLAAQNDTRVPAWAVAVPQLVLAINLAASLATHPALRRGGLAMFHVALLGCLVLLAWGRLTHFEGRVEVAQGGTFDVAAVEPSSVGPWHGDRLRKVQFEQGAFSVKYAPRLKRAHTHSQVTSSDADGTRTHTVGDDRPLLLSGFRFYTTHNKGFAPLLTWTAPGAAPLTGAVHLPSYPLFDWQQQQRWTPPGGPEARLWLRLDQGVDEQKAWQLKPDEVSAVLVIELAGQRHELKPGDVATGAFGSIRYERLIGWMGYNIHYDPTLTALWWLACLGVAGLALHLWPIQERSRAPRPAVASMR